LTFRQALGIVCVGPHPGELAPRLLTVLRTTDNLNREVCGVITRFLGIQTIGGTLIEGGGQDWI